jgi:chemotaxis protein MotB
LRQLKKNIEAAIENNKKLEKFKNQILLDLTTEGLRIQIVDEKNRPMFQSGSAQLEDYTRDILREIGKTLNEMPNKVSLSGHTDAQPFGTKGGRYSNWELSADRANASRRELISGGLADDKIVRVVGLSSAVLFDKDAPLNPINRRISIIVMNKKAEEAAQQDGGTVQIDAEEGDAAGALGVSGVAAASSGTDLASGGEQEAPPHEALPVEAH